MPEPVVLCTTTRCESATDCVGMWTCEKHGHDPSTMPGDRPPIRYPSQTHLGIVGIVCAPHGEWTEDKNCGPPCAQHNIQVSSAKPCTTNDYTHPPSAPDSNYNQIQQHFCSFSSASLVARKATHPSSQHSCTFTLNARHSVPTA